MLEKLSKMSAREAMIALAGEKPSYGELPRWLERIANRVGISFRTARSIWNEEIVDENHLAIKRLKEQAQIEEARREARRLASQYAQLAGGMRATDQDFYSTEIDRLERLKEQAQIEEARREARKLASQYAQLAGGMRATDQNFYSAEIDRLERLARIIGGLDSA